MTGHRRLIWPFVLEYHITPDTWHLGLRWPWPRTVCRLSPWLMRYWFGVS